MFDVKKVVYIVIGVLALVGAYYLFSLVFSDGGGIRRAIQYTDKAKGHIQNASGDIDGAKTDISNGQRAADRVKQQIGTVREGIDAVANSVGTSKRKVDTLTKEFGDGEQLAQRGIEILERSKQRGHQP